MKAVLLWLLKVLVELSEAGQLHHQHDALRLTHADQSDNVFTVQVCHQLRFSHQLRLQTIMYYINTRLCSDRVQTSIKVVKVSTKSRLEFESRFPDQSRFRSRCLPNCSQNAGDSLPSHQSFRRVLWKSASDYMRNANKSPKIQYSAVVTEVEKWSGICIQ